MRRRWTRRPPLASRRRSGRRSHHQARREGATKPDPRYAFLRRVSVRRARPGSAGQGAGRQRREARRVRVQVMQRQLVLAQGAVDVRGMPALVGLRMRAPVTRGHLYDIVVTGVDRAGVGPSCAVLQSCVKWQISQRSPSTTSPPAWGSLHAADGTVADADGGHRPGHEPARAAPAVLAGVRRTARPALPAGDVRAHQRLPGPAGDLHRADRPGRRRDPVSGDLRLSLTRYAIAGVSGRTASAASMSASENSGSSSEPARYAS